MAAPAEWHGPPPDVYEAEELLQLAAAAAPCPPADVARALVWLAGWERWVEAIFGIAHRAPPPGCTASLAPPHPVALHSHWEQRAAALRRGRS